MRVTRFMIAMTVPLVAMAACGTDDTSTSEPESEDEVTDSNGEELVIEGQVVANAELYEQALNEGSVKNYTAIPVGYEEMWGAFTDDTGIEVEGLRLTTEDLTQRVLTEHAADQFDADVIGSMPDLGAWQELIDAGVLASHAIPDELNIDEQYEGPDGLYHITSVGVNALAYNSEVLPDGVSLDSWEGLLDPSLKGGNITLKPAPAGSGGWAVSYFMRSEFGIDYLEQLATQEPVLDESTSAVTDRLARGEAAVGIGRPGDLAEGQQAGAPIEIVWPDEGVPAALWAMGVTSTGNNSAAGQVFMNWCFSTRGQTLLSELVLDYPVAPDAPQPTQNDEPLPTLDEVKPFMGTLEEILENRQEWTDEWNEIFSYN